LLTTSNNSRATPASKIIWVTMSPEPTGMVDLLTTRIFFLMLLAISAVTARTAVMSGVPSSAGGVPTAMKMISEFSVA